MEGSLVAYKVFTNGSVLNASEVNENLMNQAVITFSNSTVRDSAITSPIEGQLTWLEDVNRYEFYNGSAWEVLISPSTGNAIINGAFEINQRGFTSTTTDSTYGFDRWFLSAGDGTVTYSSQSFTAGELSVPSFGQPSRYARIVTTGQTLSSANGRLRQQIEGVTNFAGETITISFWAKAASGTPNVAIEFLQNFGSGGSPSAAVQTYAGQVALSTSWERKELTVAIPSISGKTLGTTANTSMLEFAIYVSAGSNFNARTGSLGIQSNTFDFWGVQIEAGSVATPFKRNANSLQGELAACQRYFQKSYPINSAPGTSVRDGIIMGANFPTLSTAELSAKVIFSNVMRSAPTIKFYDDAGTVNFVSRRVLGTSVANNQTGLVDANGQSGFYLRATSGTSAGVVMFHYTAESEL
jgi:hypothetical protein